MSDDSRGNSLKMPALLAYFHSTLLFEPALPERLKQTGLSWPPAAGKYNASRPEIYFQRCHMYVLVCMYVYNIFIGSRIYMYIHISILVIKKKNGQFIRNKSFQCIGQDSFDSVTCFVLGLENDY